MPSLVSLTAAAAILLHTLLGCCLHHQHCCASEQGRAGERDRATAVGAEHCCHSHDDHGADDAAYAAADTSPVSFFHDCGHRQHGSHDHGSDACEGGVCAFLVESAPHVDLRLDFLAHWTVAADPRASRCLLPLHGAAYHRAPLELSPLMDSPQSRLCVWRI